MQLSMAAALQFHISVCGGHQLICVAASLQFPTQQGSCADQIWAGLALRLAQIASQDLSFLTSPNFFNGTDGQHTRYADGRVASTRHSA
jgi:tryptophanase